MRKASIDKPEPTEIAGDIRFSHDRFETSSRSYPISVYSSGHAK